MEAVEVTKVKVAQAAELEPTVRYHVGSRIQIIGFGKTDKTDRPRPSLVEIFKQLKVRCACKLDSSKFNGEVIPSTEEVFPIWFEGDEQIRQDKPLPLADGLVLNPGETLMLESADCPTLVFWHLNESAVVVAHAGRDSLLKFNDSDELMAEGVVYNAGRFFQRRGRKMSRVKVFGCLGIGPEHFLHPFDHYNSTFREKNRTLIRSIREKYGDGCFFGEPLNGRLDLRQIVIYQCQKLGIPPRNVNWDGIDTFTNYDFYSHRAGDTEKNLVIVSVIP